MYCTAPDSNMRTAANRRSASSAMRNEIIALRPLRVARFSLFSRRVVDMISWAAGLGSGIVPNRSVAVQNLPRWSYGPGPTRLIALILGVALVAIGPAGHASPPDPSWIGGLYDNGDFDDVVLLITSNLGASEVRVSCSVRPPETVVGRLRPTCRPPQLPWTLASVPGRAPPSA